MMSFGNPRTRSTPLHSAWGLRPGFACLLLLISAATACGRAAQQNPAPLQLTYRLRLVRPTTHLVEVEIDAGRVTEPWLELAIPAWSPGRYAIYDFAKNVQEFEATNAEGQPLRWNQPDVSTWRVNTQNAGGAVRVRYKVYANNLNGSFSQFDTTHANLNGPSIYMYVVGHKPDPIHLEVEPPAGWKTVSGFSLAADEHAFDAPNYDRLLDTPLEASPEVVAREFTSHGKTFQVAVHSFTPGDEGDPGGQEGEKDSKSIDTLAGALKKIVDFEMSIMPDPDFSQYTFLVHFAPDLADGGDGMEHLNSTQIIVRGDPRSGLGEAEEDAAHEFFHLWNVKRLRPAGLGPFEYERENPTPSLWFAEGVTQYYSYLALLHSGLWNQDEFLRRLATEIQTLEGDPGRGLMSAESSSFHAWFYDRAPQMQETNFANTTISYYNKGALLGMLLDLEIRERTGGAKSLDDVMRYLYHKFYDAPATTYYLPGRGYGEDDIQEALSTVSGADFADFFKQYVRGTAPLPYQDVLARAGLRVTASVDPGSAPTLGVLVQQVDNGVRIVDILPGRAADRAGLSRDDVLIDVDQLSLATEGLSSRLKIYPPGAEVPFTVERHLQRFRITVKLDPPGANHYAISLAKDAAPQQIAIRDQWLSQ